MVENGFYDFLNWFDDRAWYPLGRIVGGTVYPGKYSFYWTWLFEKFPKFAWFQYFLLLINCFWSYIDMKIDTKIDMEIDMKIDTKIDMKIIWKLNWFEK
mgnify:CR=1 FL=1